jgi:hypothetical protein
LSKRAFIRGGSFSIICLHADGRFHDWAKVPQGQEIPMSKIKQGERSPDPAVRKEAHFADSARH